MFIEIFIFTLIMNDIFINYYMRFIILTGHATIMIIFVSKYFSQNKFLLWSIMIIINEIELFTCDNNDIFTINIISMIVLIWNDNWNVIWIAAIAIWFEIVYFTTVEFILHDICSYQCKYWIICIL